MQNDYLMHFNPFHDPKNGQFTSSGSSGVIGSLRRRLSGAKKTKHEEAKQKALKEGNATEVLKFKNELSVQDLQNAYNRINVERNLMRISEQELASGKSATEKFFDTVGKGANYINTASNLIEATKRFANITSKKEKSLSQELAEKFLEQSKDLMKTNDLNEELTKSVNDYLNKITNIERIAKGQNGKNK